MECGGSSSGAKGSCSEDIQDGSESEAGGDVSAFLDERQVAVIEFAKGGVAAKL